VDEARVRGDVERAVQVDGRGMTPVGALVEQHAHVVGLHTGSRVLVVDRSVASTLAAAPAADRTAPSLLGRRYSQSPA
jgi:hypothetical protein